MERKKDLHVLDALDELYELQLVDFETDDLSRCYVTDYGRRVYFTVDEPKDL